MTTSGSNRSIVAVAARRGGSWRRWRGLPISVLAVTLLVNVIKLFDLIYVLTNGGPGVSSRVIAFTMYYESIPGGQFGRGAAITVVMLILLLPIMAYNIRRFRSSRVV